MTWVTGEASSETSSTSNTDDHAGECPPYSCNAAQIGLCTYLLLLKSQFEYSSVCFQSYNTRPLHAAGHNILADGAESSGFSFCSKDYEQQGGLSKLHAISTGNTNAPLSQVDYNMNQCLVWLGSSKLI